MSNWKANGFDHNGLPEPFGGYDYQGGVRTHDDYWDCGCDDKYIHEKAVTLVCEKCGYEEDDSPDARVNEVAFACIEEEVTNE